VRDFADISLKADVSPAEGALRQALTREEQSFLKAHPIIRVYNEKDWPLLRSALNKAMAAVTPREMNQIRQKWIVADIETTAAPAALPISYGRLLGYGLAVFLVVSFLAWLLVKLIRQSPGKRESGSFI